MLLSVNVSPSNIILVCRETISVKKKKISISKSSYLLNLFMIIVHNK